MAKKTQRTRLIRIGEKQHHKLKVVAAVGKESMLSMVNALIDSLELKK
jgi:hypothetical protein